MMLQTMLSRNVDIYSSPFLAVTHFKAMRWSIPSWWAYDACIFPFGVLHISVTPLNENDTAIFFDVALFRQSVVSPAYDRLPIHKEVL